MLWNNFGYPLLPSRAHLLFSDEAKKVHQLRLLGRLIVTQAYRVEEEIDAAVYATFFC